MSNEYCQFSPGRVENWRGSHEESPHLYQRGSPIVPVPGGLLFRSTSAGVSRITMRRCVIWLSFSFISSRRLLDSRRHAFSRCGVDSHQAPTPDPQSLQDTVAESTGLRSPRRRFVCAPHPPRPADPLSNCTFDSLEPPSGAGPTWPIAALLRGPPNIPQSSPGNFCRTARAYLAAHLRLNPVAKAPTLQIPEPASAGSATAQTVVGRCCRKCLRPENR
jgi:hypothetical protein